MAEVKKYELPEWQRTIAERFKRDLLKARADGKYTPENPVPAVRICNAYNHWFEELILQNGKVFTPRHLRMIALALLSEGHPIIYTADDEYFWGASLEEMEKFVRSLRLKRDRLSEQLTLAESAKEKSFENQLSLPITK